MLIYPKRYNNFSVAGGTAGNVSGEGMYIGNDEASVFVPGGTANSFSFCDACAGYGALKWTKDKLFSAHEIKACPPISKSFMQYGDEVGCCR